MALMFQNVRRRHNCQNFDVRVAPVDFVQLVRLDSSDWPVSSQPRTVGLQFSVVGLQQRFKRGISIEQRTLTLIRQQIELFLFL